ncbi:MAG: ribbon-helix-helix protein, CopG family [Myxococcales bacterium]|nr:ribbon-helix-helix protein, CopG family [Myxococcales bacterium]
MATTTIRIPVALKARVAVAARRSGKTAHGFIREAIVEKVAQEERLADFHDVAEERYAGIVASGKTISWCEMRKYLEQRLTGRTAKRPSRGPTSR